MKKNNQDRMKKGRMVLLVGAILLLCILVFEGYYNYLLQVKASNNDNKFVLTINSGENLETIAQSLEREGIIKSKFIFLVYLGRENLDMKIQAGKHTLSHNMSIKEVAEYLMKSEDDYVDITILEGWNNKEIFTYLADKGGDKEAFLECLQTCEFKFDFIDERVKKSMYEGYLFPDTYRVSPDLEPQKTLMKILSNFQEKINRIKNIQPLENDIYNFAKERDLYDHVIVASMIEREVTGELDRKVVSGIIWKRLKQNMGLGIDATLLYALGDWKADITIEDLSMESPYNTRKYLGLPPTPISSPSYSALEASYYPEDSEYYYYLTSKTGEVIYGKTLEDHNRNKREYLK